MKMLRHLFFPHFLLATVATLAAAGCDDKALGDASPAPVTAGTGGSGVAGASGSGGASGASGSGGATAGGSGGAVADAGGGADAQTTACKTSSDVLVNGMPTGFATCDNIIHRVAKVTCPNLLPRTQMAHPASPGTVENCKSDADCTAKAHGYCDYSSGFTGSSWFCDYGCLTDQDCGAGFVCQCGDPVGACMPTNGCTSDADCTPGKLCAEASGDISQPGGTCALRLACQTSSDQCQTRADCPTATGDPNMQYCAIGSTGRRCAVVPQDVGCY
ncbi:MAG TPA: hypothetical protein VGL59_14980 [Polyangia bacterium]|jgi:hypothetical protein